MIPDKNLQLWSGAIPAPNATSNVIDVDTLRNIGVGTPLYVRVNFDTNVRVDVAGGLAFSIGYGDDSALAGLRYIATATVLVGTITGPDAGEVLYIPIAPIAHYSQQGQAFESPDNAKKYLGIVFGGYTWTAASGSVTIDIVTEINRVENIYAGGFTVK